jgi:hypothetical protein
MYQPITVEVDRACGEGAYRSHPISFTGRLLKTIQDGHATMKLYEWANEQGARPTWSTSRRIGPGRLPRRALYPFVNTTRPGPPPRRGTLPRTFLGLTRVRRRAVR